MVAVGNAKERCSIASGPVLLTTISVAPLFEGLTSESTAAIV